jgi:NADH dehydrogenase (ubiquinone) 1 beta subcomplex subunit 9
MSVSGRTSRLMLLYRGALRHSCSWMASRAHWYDEAREIRQRFESNRNITDPALIDKLLADGEAELRRKAHPDLYTAPFNPGGSLYGRNPPPQLNNIEMDFGREKGTH